MIQASGAAGTTVRSTPLGILPPWCFLEIVRRDRLRPCAESRNRDDAVLGGGVDHDRRHAPEVHIFRLHDAERDAGGHARVDRVAARVQDAEAGFGSKILAGHDHVARAHDGWSMGLHVSSVGSHVCGRFVAIQTMVVPSVASQAAASSPVRRNRCRILDKACNCWCARRGGIASRTVTIHAAASLRHATTVRGRANVALTPTAKEYNRGSSPGGARGPRSRQALYGPIGGGAAVVQRRGRRVRLAARPERLRQDHDIALHRRVRDADRGQHPAQRQPIEQQPPNRRNIGLVFQNYALFPHLTIFENVAFGLRLRRVGEPS